MAQRTWTRGVDRPASAPSAEAVAKKHAAENSEGDGALSRDAYIQEALGVYAAAVSMVTAIDPEKLGKALAELDGMHTDVQRAEELDGQVAAWVVAVDKQIGRGRLTVVEHDDKSS